MIRLFLFIALLFCQPALFAQAFLDVYKEQVVDKAEKAPAFKNGSAKERKHFFTRQLKQFEIAFEWYRHQTGVNFDTTDSVSIIIQTRLEDSSSEVCIWNHRDTLVYREGNALSKNKSAAREIVYSSFAEMNNNGLPKTTSLATVMMLITAKDYLTLINKSKENPSTDNSGTIIMLFARYPATHAMKKFAYFHYDFY